MPKIKRIIFAVEQELFDLIQAERIKTGVSISEFIRRLILKHFEKN